MAKRRSNNEGTIYKKKNGAWRAQLTLNGKRLSKTTDSHGKALEWLGITKNKIADGHNFRGGQATLVEFLEGWLVSSRSSRLPETISIYQSVLRGNVIPLIGGVKLHDLRPDHIQHLYNRLAQAGKSQHALHTVHKILHTALEQAVKIKILPTNPTNTVETPPRPHVEMAFLDDNQVQTLLLTAKLIEDRHYPLYYLAINTGMRQAELLGLKWEDVSWSRKKITVKRQLIRKRGGGYVFRKPKTRSGTRSIALGHSALKILKDQQKNLYAWSRKKSERWKDLDLVFPSYVGTPLMASKLRIALKNVLMEASLPRIRFHDLRHTAASLMLNFGVPLIVVSKRLGHAKPSITLNEYGHLIPSMQEEAAKIMDELLTPVSLPVAPKLHPK